MKKILMFLPEDICAAKFKAFEEKYADSYELIYTDNNRVTDEDFKSASAIIGNPVPSKLLLCKNLEWFAIDFAGTDRYIETVRQIPGLKFTNASGGFGVAIAEHMLSVVLALCKKLNLYRDNQKGHIWKDEGKEMSLIGKRVLIVGTGDIGSSFAKLVKAFSCETIGINTTGNSVAYFDKCYSSVELKNQLKDADVVAMCVPRNASTDNLLDREAFSLMKDSAVVINVGRGNSIDEDALIEALTKGKIYGAALDVFREEPLKDSALWDIDNLIITPHISGKTYGHLDVTINKVLDICLENLYRYVEGNELKNLVDMNTGYRKVKND